MHQFALLLLLAVACAAAEPAAAQTYPARPIRVIVPGTAGSANDFTARAIAQRLTDAWGQQIVIDNRAGAGGIIAHEMAAKATPDGYTLIFSTSAGLVISPLLHKAPYDSFRDLAPISLASTNPQMLFSHNWYAMLAPAGTPAVIIAKLNAEIVKMIADPPFAQRLIDLGSEPQSSTPAELGAYMRKESERWNRVIKGAGLKIER